MPYPFQETVASQLESTECLAKPVSNATKQSKFPKEAEDVQLLILKR